MPRKPRIRTRRRPARRRRRYRRRYPLMTMPSGGPAGLTLGKFRYAETILMTSTAGALSSYRFRANGCYDPYYEASGHQPMGWDKQSAYWKRYIVLGSKITVIISPSAALTYPVYTGVYLNNTLGSVASTVNAIIETKKGTVRQLPVGSSDPRLVRSTFSCKKFFNITDPKDKVGDLGALVTADPTTQAYYQLWIASVSGTQSAYAQVTIEYCVQFQDPVYEDEN